MPLLNTRAPIMGGKCEAGELASNDASVVTGKRDNEHMAHNRCGSCRGIDLWL